MVMIIFCLYIIIFLTSTISTSLSDKLKGTFTRYSTKNVLLLKNTFERRIFSCPMSLRTSDLVYILNSTDSAIHIQ